MSAGARGEISDLHDLAHACGVVVRWHDTSGIEHEVAPDALVGVLRALGIDLDGPAGAPTALAAVRDARARRALAPTIVAWDDDAVTTVMRLPPGDADEIAECRVRREDGAQLEWRADLGTLPIVDAERGETEARTQTVGRRLEIPGGLPLGYHRLDVDIAGRRHSATIVVSPTRGAAGDDLALEGRWGLVAPVYALRDERGGVPGDVGHLGHLAEAGSRYGASVIATLPVLAAFLRDPLEVSPYLPVSRRFWNELYITPERVPELASSPQASACLSDPERRAERLALRDADRVDYARAASMQREVLEALAASLPDAPPVRRTAFDDFVAARPEVAEYARFRAAGERFGADWRAWPARMRDGAIDQSDVDPSTDRYHRYVQWIAQEQLDALADDLRRRGQLLALDLPLGTHPWGYDVWRSPGTYGVATQAGAPPDAFATDGQGWGFAPVHPEASRADGHAEFRDSIAHHLRVAKLLRIDHVMGLHRQWWVPDGARPTEGAYVRYPAEELWAVVCLEASRAGAAIVGENLGTVPDEVWAALGRHGARGMAVAQFRADPNDIGDAPAGTVAMWGTHDMPTFGGWHDDDCAPDVLRQRFDTFLTALADSDADVVVVGPEDLALHPVAHNLPGTLDEQNWRVPCPFRIEELDADPARATSLRILADRRGRRAGPGTSG